jgi:Ca2+-binding RTX toxin-like protein
MTLRALLLRVTTATALAAAPIVFTGTAHAATPECFGQRATIVGTDDPDTIHGSPGDDVIVAGAGADTVYGEGGDDLICSGHGGGVDEEGAHVDRIFGGPGDDKIDGGPKDIVPDEDYLVGGHGDDVLYGGADRDTLDDGPGHDRAYGGTGFDTFYAGAGNDLIVGGPDSETTSNQVSYETSPAGVVIDLRADTETGDGNDVVKHIWSVIGSPFDDVIKGTPRIDSMSGGCGDDRLIGRGGNDHLGDRFFYASTICDDTSASDDDTMLGGSGNDFFFGETRGHGTDVIHAGPGNDELVTRGGGEHFYGGVGIDLFSAFMRHLAIHMDLADGRYTVGRQSGRVGNVENVQGSIRDDVIRGTNDPNLFVGFGGADRLYGRGGDDDLRGDGRHEQDPSVTDKTVGGGGSDYCRAEVERSCER